MKKILSFLLVIILSSTSLAQTTYANSDMEKSSKVFYNNNVFYLDNSFTLENEQILFPLKDISKFLDVNINWNHFTQKAYYSVNGINSQFNSQKINTKSYVSLNEVKKFTSAYYDSEYNALILNSTLTHDEMNKILAKNTGYTQEDVKWLSQIINAEARGESFISKVAVGNVILNRVQNEAYPNTIKGVIFDKKHGVQFTPSINGSIYKDPSIDSFLAAIDTLKGYGNENKALFFINPQIAKSSWVSRNRTLAFVSENHNFYY